MNIHNHTAKALQSSFCELGKLAMIKIHLNEETFQTLLHAYITSCISYCNYRLYKIQQPVLSPDLDNMIIFTTHSTGYKRLIFKVLLMTYKALINQAPHNIYDLLHQVNHITSLRYMDDHLILHIPPAKMVNYSESTFSSTMKFCSTCY